MGKNERFTTDVRQIISCAREETHRLRHRLVGTEHLLLSTLKMQNPLVEGLFASLHVNTASLIQALDFVMGRGNKAILSEPVLSVPVRVILARAEEEAERLGSPLVGIEHLLLALLGEQNSVTAGVLESFGVDCSYAQTQLFLLIGSGYEHMMVVTEYHSRYAATPVLNQVSRDLTLAALEDRLDPLIGRQVELERTMQILSRRTKNNPVLVGPAGVGKTAIAEGLALRIVQGQVPDNLRRCRVVSLDVGLLSVGTRFRGDFEERLKRILYEVISTPGIIIVIDELHTLVQTGVVEGSLDAANLFKPMLARGEFQCIGATTMDDYRKTIESDPALERRFQPVQVVETSVEETVSILQGLRTYYEKYHRVVITEDALQVAVDLSTRYINHRCQPDKALDLLDEASSRVNVQRAVVPEHIQLIRGKLQEVQQAKETAILSRDFPLAAQMFRQERQVRREMWQLEQTWQQECREQRPVVRSDDIAEVVAMWTGIPVTQMREDEILRLLHLEDEMHKRVIGQCDAVRVVASAVRRSRTRLRDLHRPIGSFIFVGPTGVGKTELARALAIVLFGSEDAMLKLDMSEFMESHTSARLIGSPPGYIGYHHAGQLTEFVRRRPYCVILFDEIEKAHPKVSDLLLQILEDGCLTDTHGQAVSFQHSILILTSNVVPAHLASGTMTFTCRRDPSLQKQEPIDHVYQRELIINVLREVFRPELLNRVDDIVIFHTLEQEQLRQIVDLFLSQTRQRLEEQEISLLVSDLACLFLLQCGYSEEYGARPLRQLIQRLVVDRIAEAMLKGLVLAGTTVLIGVEEEILIMKVMSSTGEPVLVSDGGGDMVA